MPTKKLRVSFDIDVDVLASALAHGHHAMRIETYEEPVEAVIVPPKQLRLPKPKGRKNGMQRAILDVLRTRPLISSKEIKSLSVKLGYSEKSVPNQIYLMLEKKWIRRRGPGVYGITKKGERE